MANDKLTTPLLDGMKKEEEHPYIKSALWAYHEDVLNDNFPNVVLTPECESVYLRAYLEGCIHGFKQCEGIFTEPAPTLNRQVIGIEVSEENSRTLHY